MKKAFNLKFLALSLVLLAGNLSAWAARPAGGPAGGTAVGATIKNAIATYRVVNDGETINGVSYTSGWDDTNKAYLVKITGLDADGLDALDASTLANLEIPVTFKEKFGEEYYNYYVVAIEPGLDAAENPQSFYGYTEITGLKFVAAPKNEDGTAGTAVIGLDKFTYTVGDLAFYGCTGMRTLEFTENCKTIGKYAFQNTSIRSFVIPKQCETIDEYAFYNCGFLNTVTVASGNTAMHTLGTHVFGNSSLEVLDLTNASQLWTITGEPFMYELSSVNDVLTTVTLPASVRQINYAFKNCTALTTINGFDATNLGDGVAGTPTGAPKSNQILDGAFEGCRSLTQLDIPNCDVIGSPFVGCAKLAKLTFVADYNKEIGQTLTLAGKKSVFGTYDLLDANYAEKDQKALTTLEFKGAFRGTIQDGAFVGSLALATVDFKGVLTNGAKINTAFKDVTSLTAVKFAGINTWANTTLKDGNVTIGASAFQNTGITALDFKTINLEGSNNGAFTISANAFSDCAALKDGVTFGNITVKNTGTIDIKGTAFIRNPLLEKVTFGSTTFEAAGRFNIDDDAFATGNEGLTAVEFGSLVNEKSGAGVAGTFVIGNDDNITGIIATPETDNEALVFGDGAHLQTVKFAAKDGEYLQGGFVVSAGAFASTALTSVEFGDIKAPKNLATASGFGFGKNAFKGGAASGKTVKFKTIKDNGTSTDKGQLSFFVRDEAFAAESLKSVEFGDIQATNPSIGEKAFQGKSLKTVKIGNITASNVHATTFGISANAFQGGEVDAKTVTIGEIKDYKNGTTEYSLDLGIGATAFAGDKLTTVKIAIDADGTTKSTIGATKVVIANGAFRGKSLETVELGNITAGNVASTFDIADNAFQGGDTENKTVNIGTITDKNTTATLTATIGENAFAADALKSVTIDHMTATSLTIGNKAFAGKKLDIVDLGNMTAATLNITGANAFANENEEDVMTESITIGELGAGLNITGTKVFQGPQADGSALNVTIAKIAGAAKIPAETFIAPKKGTAAYTVKGDVAAGALANVVADAFVGSQENVLGTPENNTTSVKFQGDYNADFTVAAPVFTNVNDVELAVDKDGKAKNYNVEGNLKFFGDAKTVTIGNIPATKYVIASHATYCSKIEEVKFVGSVEGNIRKFISPVVRKIDFANVDQAKVIVVEGAVKNEAFQAAAADAAAKGENITVRYYEGYDGQTREAKQIFGQQAFGTAYTDAKSVTLYTTPWAKANVFEAADLKDPKKTAVYRLAYSDSEVAPGDAIEAAVYKKEGNTYAYGKLYVPAGINMKYKVNAEYNATEKKNAVQLYYGRIDNSNNEISMYNLPVIDGYYWIDATEVDQVFVVRTNTELKSEMKVEAEPVTAEEDAIIVADITGDYYYWDAALAVQNQLRFATQDIIHSELMNNAEFKDRNVYYMANPVKHGFGFILFDKSAKYTKANGNYEIGDYKPLVKNSLYVVGKENTNARMLTIVFADEETNTTGIETVETAEQNSDAIYNLQGVRVNNATKGIFIKNGKKVVIK